MEKGLEGPYEEWLRALGVSIWSRGETQGSAAPISAPCEQGQNPGNGWSRVGVQLGDQGKVLPPEDAGALNREWVRPRGCQGSRNVWTTLSGMHRVGFWGVCGEAGVGLDDPDGSLPTQGISRS